MKKLLKLNPKYFTFLIIFIASFFAIFEPKNAGAAHANQFNSNLENYNNKLQIFDKKHKIAEFKIAIANSDKKRAIGLMNLDHLPQNHGMLFIFEKNQIVAMWMKNTKIPLDMIFIDENDRIITIKNNAQPFSLDIISSQKKAAKALEINGRLAEKLKIKIGQKIILTK